MSKHDSGWPPKRVYVVHPVKKTTSGWTPAAFMAYRLLRRARQHGPDSIVAEYRLVTPGKKDPAAVSLGKRGGAKGGHARAAALGPERRKAIAKKAARARWGSRT